MKNRYAKISFLASGHVIQDVLLTDPELTPEKLIDMLNNGEAVTTVQEGKDVCVTIGDWLPIAEVSYVEAELDYKDFQLEDAYELESHPVPFDVSRLARAFAVGEFISDTDELSLTEIFTILEKAGENQPVGLALEEGSMDMTGDQLLYEIEMSERGLKNIMTLAYNAGKDGKEII